MTKAIDQAILKCSQELLAQRKARETRQKELLQLQNRLADKRKELEQKQRRVLLTHYNASIRNAYASGEKKEIPACYIVKKQAFLCHAMHQTYEVMDAQLNMILNQSTEEFLQNKMFQLQDEKPQRQIKILNVMAASLTQKKELEDVCEDILASQEELLAEFQPGRHLQLDITSPSRFEVVKPVVCERRRPLNRSLSHDVRRGVLQQRTA